MADEEMDDLDGLDDFGSNDFEDNLDDFMEGDLGAGDEDGDGGGDSELDSFFEDLSTIDDLEVKEDEPEEEDDEPIEEEGEPEIEEPEAEEPPPPAKDKKPILVPAIIAAVIGMILGAIAVGVMWWINQPEDLPPPPPTTLPPTTLMPRPVQPVITVPTMPPTTLAPVKALPPPPKKLYYVQVSNCIYRECIDDYRFLLKRYGYKATIVLQDEKAPMTEVISRQVIGEEEAAKWVDRINQENQLPGEAYRKSAGSRYRVSLGLFPDLDTAARVKVYLNQLYAKQLVFEAKQAAQTIRYSKVRAGQFSSREEAVQLQKILLEKDPRFRGAFVVSVIE